MALKRTFLAGLTILLFLSSCNDESPCPYSDLTTRVDMGFYSRSSETAKDTSLNAFTFYAVIRPDSLIRNNAVNVQKIEVPLDPHNDRSLFIMRIADISDTLEVFHRNKQVLEDFACGFHMQHEITSVVYSRNLIDTLEIRQPVIDLFEDENLRIYMLSDTAAQQ